MQINSLYKIHVVFERFYKGYSISMVKSFNDS